MRVRHPYALDDDAPAPDGTVHYGGRRRWADVAEDGTFHVPDDEPHNLDEWAERYGYRLGELVVDENGSADRGESEAEDASDEWRIENGECPWCDDYEGEAVPQHASSAHPELWAAYKDHA